MTKRLEFWFDFSCPYAYVASTQAEAVAARAGAELDPRPMLLGGVFRARGTAQNLAATLPAAKAQHNFDDMRRQAKLAGAPLAMPAGHPLRTVLALRCVLAVGAPMMPLVHRFYRAYWAEGRDISQTEVVAAVLTEAGLDAPTILEQATSEAIKADLRRRTDEAIARGVFGVPTWFVGDELFWGSDRLDLVATALTGHVSVPELPTPTAPVDFYFDYSSPFAYLALTQAEARLGACARWRPLLLGGLFRDIGTPEVPLFTQSPAKQQHTQHDLFRLAARAGIPICWPSRFPMSSLLALRLTLHADLPATPAGRALIVRISQALWRDDQNIADPTVLANLADECGFPGAALVAEAGAAKPALLAATQAAQAAGVFGVPTFVVHPPQTAPARYWGFDRLDWVVRAAAGDPDVL